MLLDADKIQRLEQFGDDTWDLLEVIEKSFGVEFTEDELIAARTIGLLSECITRAVQGSEDVDGPVSTEVFPKLCRVVAKEIGMKAERIIPETAFPQGLGIF